MLSPTRHVLISELQGSRGMHTRRTISETLRHATHACYTIIVIYHCALVIAPREAFVPALFGLHDLPAALQLGTWAASRRATQMPMPECSRPKELRPYKDRMGMLTAQRRYTIIFSTGIFLYSSTLKGMHWEQMNIYCHTSQ